MENTLNIEPLEIAGKELKQPFIISGPCSAESEEQVMATGRQLAEMEIPVYRAGIWKPRTRPGGFEGLGEVALPWLQKLKEETGLVIATEVANAYHIKQALDHGVDILWIGARTTANPFAVQEIADYLAGKDVTVFVKNPVNPDIDLWTGALERMNKAGIKKLAAVHRGFTFYGPSNYRNEPLWSIPIELKRRFPNLPLINDPSHITGNKALIPAVCQKALDLDFNGFLIESHIDPANALSDKAQQVTPAELKIILEGLVWRKPEVNGLEIVKDLEDYRAEIDRLDTEIMQIFRNRMKVVEKIGEYKKKNGVTILQSGRWSDILEDRSKIGTRLGLSEDFVSIVLKAIHQESINRQTDIMNRG